VYRRDFYRKLDREETDSVYVFTGGSGEDYRQALLRLKASLVEESLAGFNYLSFGAIENRVEEVVEAVRIRAMGGGSRLVVLQEAEILSSGDQKKIMAYLGDPEPDNCLVVVTTGLKGRHPLIKMARESGIMVDFTPPRWETMEEGINEYLRYRGLSITPEALKFLEGSLSGDRGLMKRELDKVALFMGDEGTITLEDLQDLLVARGEQGVFDLTGHIQRGEVAQAAMVLDRLLEEGQYPGVLVGMLARQYRLIWMAREAAASEGGQTFQELARLPRGIAQSLAADSRKFTREDLISSLLALREVDRLLKSTSLPADLLLESFLGGMGEKALETGGFGS
jgi:DNA polymerase-3 subunit delta